MFQVKINPQIIFQQINVKPFIALNGWMGLICNPHFMSYIDLSSKIYQSTFHFQYFTSRIVREACLPYLKLTNCSHYKLCQTSEEDCVELNMVREKK